MKPDFSGEYVLNRRASALSLAAAAIQSARLRIDHHEPVFHCAATFVADRTLEFSFERATDGREVAADGNEVCRMYWDGSALVSEDRAGSADSGVTICWRYELVDDGRHLRATEQIRGGGRDQDNVWEFDRQ
jgi:hypothetical protein